MDKVLESGRAQALEPMSSADRKIVHDTAAEIDGVSTESEGEDPRRRRDHPADGVPAADEAVSTPVVTSAALPAVLEDGRDSGFLGPGPVEPHIRARRAARGLPDRRSAGGFLDLGSGGGVPGLVLARRLGPTPTPCCSTRRSAGASSSPRRRSGSDWPSGSGVRCGRAEELARDARVAGRLPSGRRAGVRAPAVVAECGSGSSRRAVRWWCSEPPTDTAAARPAAGAWTRARRSLGFGAPEPRREHEVGVVVLTKTAPTEDRWPRRDGVPGKRPLW